MQSVYVACVATTVPLLVTGTVCWAQQTLIAFVSLFGPFAFCTNHSTKYYRNLTNMLLLHRANPCVGYNVEKSCDANGISSVNEQTFFVQRSACVYGRVCVDEYGTSTLHAVHKRTRCWLHSTMNAMSAQWNDNNNNNNFRSSLFRGECTELNIFNGSEASAGVTTGISQHARATLLHARKLYRLECWCKCMSAGTACIGEIELKLFVRLLLLLRSLLL